MSPGWTREPFFEFRFRIEPAQHGFGDFDAGQDAFLLDEQLHPAAFVVRDARERRMVAVADVLADGQFDQVVDERDIFFLHVLFDYKFITQQR